MHHPRYNHFPYTTLFRSGNTSSPTGRAYVLRANFSKIQETSSTRSKNFRNMQFDTRMTTTRGFTGEVFLKFLLDRKSTRLNSSHVSISYAVFCLKKIN